jgi:hypothetical protein
MKIIKQLFLLLSIALIANSCRKDIVHVDPDFVGYWATNYDPGTCNMAIVISSGSQFHYYSPTELSDCKRAPDISGLAKADDKIIKVGQFHSYTINQKPFRMDTLHFVYSDGCCSQFGQAVWQMKVDGTVYYKVIGK